MIEARHAPLSVAKQCELLGLSRSSFYYRRQAASPLGLQIMHAIDRIYTQYPFYGVRRIQQALRHEGYAVNHKRVHRLMQRMGLQAIYPRPSRSAGDASDRVYPYLLRDRVIDRPDQVWASDITYLPLLDGFVYLVAIMDWFSRYVLSWRIANTLDAAFCLAALEEALTRGRPEIFNTDQGRQFTCADFTQRVEGAGVRMSMDGRGRCMDNVFIERLWRSLKYEDIYLNAYETVAQITEGVDRYFDFYNQIRFHQALDYATPAQIYRSAA